jgi:hypothetical protein
MPPPPPALSLLLLLPFSPSFLLLDLPNPSRCRPAAADPAAAAMLLLPPATGVEGPESTEASPGLLPPFRNLLLLPRGSGPLAGAASAAAAGAAAGGPAFAAAAASSMACSSGVLGSSISARSDLQQQ